MRTYKRENLTPKEREILAAIIRDDLDECRKWVVIWGQCPTDTEDRRHEIANAEELAEKESLLRYLNGELKEPNEAYFIGYLTAYIRHKAAILNAELLNKAEFLDEDEAATRYLHRKAGQLSALRRMLGGDFIQDPPIEWEA